MKYFSIVMAYSGDSVHFYKTSVGSKVKQRCQPQEELKDIPLYTVRVLMYKNL